MTVDYDYVAN